MFNNLHETQYYFSTPVLVVEPFFSMSYQENQTATIAVTAAKEPDSKLVIVLNFN